MMLLGLLGIGMLVTGAVDAPITSVTVYSDRVRVERTAHLTLSGTQRVALPLLRGGVDPASIRVEAQGAEVTRVDLRSVSEDAFVPAEARKELDALDTLDAQLERNRAEREVCSAQIAALGGLQPGVPSESQEGGAPPPRLDPSGWGAATTFVLESTSKLQERLRALNLRSEELSRERELRLQAARELGATPRGPGLEVAPTLSGNGPVKLTLAYLTANARWYPYYELQLLPASNQVKVSFFGLVSQETGEDWKDTEMTLSTAIPATVTTLPRIATWKIGQRERFIPTPEPLTLPVRPPPPVPPVPREASSDIDRLRERLYARIGTPPATASLPVSTSAPAQPQRAPAPEALGAISGVVTSTDGRGRIADVVVTATSPSTPEEFVVVTDSQGQYQFPKQMPPGVYSIRFDREGFKPFVRADVTLRSGHSLRVAVELLPEAFTEMIEIAAAPPAIDVGSTTTGLNMDQKFIRRVGGGPPDVSAGSPRFSSGEDLSTVTVGVGLVPPGAYQRPIVDPRLPASLAGGYDLAFAASRAETVQSGTSGRQVPLFTETWPVKVERKLFPALTRAAFVVAELQSPSKQVLPGGEASLFVGADPAGSASLGLVSPGERFTLPLGVDRAVRPVRNVTLVQSEKGFLSKAEETAYRVTIEVANPYAVPLPVRIHDQWPLTQDEHVEIKLTRTEPYARQDKVNGTLEWELTVPASGRTVATFEYTLRHPKGWRMHQSQ
ncbi:mucoidy inhibitor MuiA family protein [Hyalangium versicolor]|uniref:mucoidy inhibitor MuiA family protein n=1 Tax=Hyalangium versicolor TaxID=2861190 RepID=UPI001CCF47A7|nr:mucoidy inhibitor MuiA family protein [Hyalangium versicolor]